MPSTINADNGVVSGSSGLKSTADATGVLALQTNGTTAVTVDASQNVGIGVTPSAWSVAYPNILQTEGGSIFGDPAGSEGNFGVNTYYNAGYKYAANGYASVYQQYNAQHIFKTAVSGTAGNAISFTNSLVFGKGTTLALEGATSNSGTGITFPATVSLSSNANTLDDYEEGTWTPTITGSSVSGSQTYGTRYGGYTKIGRQVTLNFFVALTAKGTISGNIYLSGYPFTSSSTSNDVRYGRNIIGFENLATNWVWLSSINDGGITYSYMAGLKTAASTSATNNLTDADLTNTSAFSGSVIYNAS
jgi:hypothetical protein